ncbi:MAG: HAD-IA family hydrolase [Candidatus Pacebacteria bacterium]|nr:HAD-IA family hydrolase [Candidatus Paceibacterota bacterium]
MKTILVDALQTFVTETEGISGPLHELLDEYENTKIILTNADDAKAPSLHLDEMPYEVYTRKVYPKSEPEYYEGVLEHYKLTPEQVVYIEHSPTAAQAAEDAGILTHYFDPEEKDIESVKEFLDAQLY